MPRFAVNLVLIPFKKYKNKSKKSKAALNKNIQLSTCTESFQKIMAFFSAYEIHLCIYEKKLILIECIHWHWQFNCDLN